MSAWAHMTRRYASIRRLARPGGTGWRRTTSPRPECGSSPGASTPRRSGPRYEDAVEEALCFGWIDSIGRKLDDDRTMLWFSPRKVGSGWARPNKERVERLTAAGLMTPAGQRVIDAAKADGSWSRLDDVDNFVVPDDLADALDSHPPAREHWDAFPRSVRRSILEWIMQAKRDTTRAARIEETARLAQQNERANQWRPKDKA